MASGGVTGYAAISARVRAMYADLLTQQDLLRLNDSPDFPTLFSSLKSTAYGPYLEGLKDKEITPKRVISQVKGKLAASYYSVIQMAPENTRPLVKQLYRYYEIGNLKAVLRALFHHGILMKQRFGTGYAMCFSRWGQPLSCPRRQWSNLAASPQPWIYCGAHPTKKFSHLR
jgi:vacuolar-type H+-ATPase subunit C/Vma6